VFLTDAPPALRAVLLGLVQGLTEFLPISSSAHLILLPRILSWPDQGLVADAAANTGTLLAVLVYFRRDLRATFGAAFDAARRGAWRALGVAPSASSSRAGDDRLDPAEGTLGNRSLADAPSPALPLWLALATLPVGLAGMLASDWVGTQGRNPIIIAVMTLTFGLVLLVADRVARQPGRSVATLTLRDALLLGTAQALALVPGVSRAGITMTAALFARFGREQSARLSFLLAIPVGLLVAAKDLYDLWRAPDEHGGWLFGLLVVATSACAGWLVIKLLLGWLRRRSLLLFVGYRLLLGILLVAVFWR
jgi:undecaprenyl-diphosphatase